MGLRGGRFDQIFHEEFQGFAYGDRRPLREFADIVVCANSTRFSSIQQNDLSQCKRAGVTW